MSRATRYTVGVQCLVAAAVLAAFAAPAAAQSTSSGRAFSESSPFLLGDWGGERTKLANDGVNFFFSYSGQGAYNATGGSQNIARLANQWLFGASLDLNKLVHWKGASFDITVGNRSGRSLNNDAQLGADIGVFNDFGPAETWWLTEFALDQKFFDGRVSWRIGRMPAGTDFNTANLCDFQNLVFCGTPFTNVTSYSTFFDMGQWGTRVKIYTHKQDYFEIGTYQVNPKYYDPSWEVHHGLSLDIPSGTTGWMYRIEYGWNTKIGGMPGSYQFGGWYSTAPISDLFYGVNGEPFGLTDMAPRMHHSDYGLFFDADQRLTDNGSGRGFSLFLNLTQSNPSTESIDQLINVGFKYHEPFNRPDDYIGVGFGAYDNNYRAYDQFVQQNGTDYSAATNTFVGHGYEYHLEAFYKWYWTQSVQLLPDIQYIVHPSGSTRNANAFLIGLTTEINF